MKASKFVVQFSSQEESEEKHQQKQKIKTEQKNQNPQNNNNLTNNRLTNHKMNFQDYRTKPKLNIKEFKPYLNQGSIKKNVIIQNPKNNQDYQSEEQKNRANQKQNKQKIFQSNQENYLSKTDPNKPSIEKQPSIIKESTSNTRRNRIHKIKLDPLAQLHKTEAVRLNFFENQTKNHETKKTMQTINQNKNNNFNQVKNQQKRNQQFLSNQSGLYSQSASKLSPKKKQKIFYFDESDNSDTQANNKINFEKNKNQTVNFFNQNEEKDTTIKLKNVQNINQSKEYNQTKMIFQSAKNDCKQLQKNNRGVSQSERKIKRKHLDLGDISQCKEKHLNNQLQIDEKNQIQAQNGKKNFANTIQTPKHLKTQYEQLSMNGLEDLKLFLMKPLKANSILRLIFKRDQSVLKWFSPQFNIYIQNTLSFLFAAKKVSSKPTSKFLLSTYKEVFNPNFPSYIGKMKSNIFGQILNIFGPGLNPEQAKQNFTQPRQLLATIVYNTNAFGPTNKPRSFKVYVKNYQSNYYKVFPQVRTYGEQISLDALYLRSESNKNHIKVYKTKQPKFCKKQKAYTLDFYGRVKVSSIKNFILEQEGKQNTIPSLLFGKVSQDVFHLDIYEGMSANIGFCIALSCFDSRVGE